MCDIAALEVNLDLCRCFQARPLQHPGFGGVGMNKVASTTWLSILVLLAIVVTALVLYNN